MKNPILRCLAVALAASAPQAVSAATLMPINGPNLSTHIDASLTNLAQNTTTLYGTTTSPTGQDVVFTSPTAIHITGGSGFASITDSTVADAGVFRQLIMNPDPFFTAYQFSVALAADSYILVEYSLVGGPGVFLSALTAGTDPFAQATSTNKDYQLTAGAGQVFDAIRLTTCSGSTLASCNTAGGGSGSAFNFIKQNSIITTDRVGNPVPEPATWAMMLVGFGAAGYSLRRRRRVGALQAA